MERAEPRTTAGPDGSLLEREQELERLGAVLRGLREGDARVVLVEGAAGIGKSRLLAETRRHASESGIRVLAARGSEFEREFAFGVVRQLFEPSLRGADSRERLLDGAADAARAVFDSIEPGDDTEGDRSFAVLHGLYWLTVNLGAEQPLLLAIDDLHWCDHPSLRFLAFLVRRLEGLPVAVVCGLRPSEPGVDTALLAELAGDPLALSLRPRPLSQRAVAELVRARLGAEADPPFAAACESAAGGNPLLLNELLRALEAEGVRPTAAEVPAVEALGPRAASRAVLLRLARLPDDAIAVARAVAVLGDGASVARVAALSELDEPRVARAAGELARAEILGAETSLGFVHPLIAAAIYHDVPPAERALHHERAARMLADEGAPAEQVAAQLIAIPPRGEPWVAATLRDAAHTALHRGAAESAITYLGRALAEPPPDGERAETLLELGLAEALTSGPAAAQHLRQAYEAIADPVARAHVGVALARTLVFTALPIEGAAILQRAAAELPPGAVDLRRTLEAFELAALLFAGESEAFRRLTQYRTLREEGTGAKMLAGLASFEWTYANGPAADCAALASWALAGGEVIAADNGAVIPIAATLVLTFADRDEAVDVWRAAFDDAHRRGSLFAIGGVRLWHGFTLFRRGELDEATQEIRQALDDFALWGFGAHAGVYSAALLGLALLEAGDVAGARQALSRPDDPEVSADAARYWLNAHAEVLLAEGRADAVVAVSDEIAARWPDVVNPAVGAWRGCRALALDRLARHEEALDEARAELALARDWGAPWALGRSLRVLGTLEGEQGLGRLAEAVDVLTGSPARAELAKALAALGSSLRLARRPSEAREPLRRALELATVCGANGLAEQARSELYATGARPRSAALSGVDALTPSELRVASLAAEGNTNRDIAQALYVTPKTVEVHLSSAYRKLGIRSRRELAGVLTPA